MYTTDQELLQSRRAGEVALRKMYHLREQLGLGIQAMQDGRPTQHQRAEVRHTMEQAEELIAAGDGYFRAPEVAKYEALTQWAGACLERDIAAKTSTVDAFRSYQSWLNTTASDAPPCPSLEDFQEVLQIEAGIRVRFEQGRGWIEGRLTAAQTDPEPPAAQPGTGRNRPPALR